MSSLRTSLGAFAFIVVGTTVAGAQPIQSPQDQACRNEATRQVMGNPQPGVDPYVRGRQIWTACMARSGKGVRSGGGKSRKASRNSRRSSRR